MNTDFQAEVHRLRASHSADELRFLTTLGPLAAKVQAPVFEQFGLPPGQRGVILMKMGVRLLSMVAPDIKELAGDLREMLCLPREEEDISSTIKKAESDLTALLEYPVLRIIQTIKRHQKTIGNYMYCICGKACRKPIDAFLFNSLIATFGFPYNSKGLFFYMTLPDPQSQVTNSKDQPIHAHPIPSHPIPFSIIFPQEFQALERKIASAPLDVRGPLAEAFLLPYKASPTEIAQAIPGLQKRAKELAKHHMAPVASALTPFYFFLIQNKYVFPCFSLI